MFHSLDLYVLKSLNTNCVPLLGTGVNAQQRAVAVHHLEVPWRPADLEQRNGRAVRKGNTVKFWGGNVVDIIIYGTEKTLDAYKFNLLRNKQLFINQINNGTIAVRRIDEDSMDEYSGMNFAEFVAVLSGNMDLLNKAKLDNRIMQLEKEQAIFNKERYRAERKIAKTEQDIVVFAADGQVQPDVAANGADGFVPVSLGYLMQLTSGFFRYGLLQVQKQGFPFSFVFFIICPILGHPLFG